FESHDRGLIQRYHWRFGRIRYRCDDGGGQFARYKKDRLIGCLGDLHGSGLWVYELLTPIVSTFEPGAERGRGPCASLRKRDRRMVGGLQTIVGDCQDGCEQVLLVFAENLNNVTIRLGIEQFEHVSARRQYLGTDARYFDRLAEREAGFLVQGLCLDGVGKQRAGNT